MNLSIIFKLGKKLRSVKIAQTSSACTTSKQLQKHFQKQFHDTLNLHETKTIPWVSKDSVKCGTETNQKL